MSRNIDGVNRQNPINPLNLLSLQQPGPQNQLAPVAGDQGEQSTISTHARQEPSAERTDLLKALKHNYGGNDRIQTSQNKLNSLSTDKLKEVKRLREFDVALTKHEEDHHNVAADLARSGPLYETAVGPDGAEYRKSGKVMIDTGVDKDDETTIKKMKQVRAAALAPDGNQLAPLSDQDKKVAAEATEKEKKAQARLDKKSNGPALAGQAGQAGQESKPEDDKSNSSGPKFA